jgi:hypothetical protein
VVGAAVLATAASAQTLPVPTLPPEPPPEVEAPMPGQGVPETHAAPGTSRDRWEYNLGVGAGYDSNIAFRVADGPDSWAVSPRGRLARVFTGEQGELRLGVSGSWRGYRDVEAFNRYNAGADLGANFRSSLTTTWQAGASYDLGYSDSSQILTDQGVLLPLVRTWSAAGYLGMSRTLGAHTSFRLQGRFHRVEFDEQDALASGLATGQSLRGTAGLERKLGQYDSASIEYSLQATLSHPSSGLEENGRPYYFTHFGSLQWNHVLSGRSAFMLEGGASYTPESERAGLARRVSFYGGASYSHRLRHSDLTLFVRREVTPAFGLGVSRVQTRLGVDAAFRLGRYWTFRLRGTHIIFESSDVNAVPYGTPDEVFASLSRRFGRHFSISGEGRYRRRGAVDPFPTVEAYQVGLFLTLSGG